MDGNEPEVYVRHLLICDRVTYDPGKPGSEYTLSNLVETVRPADEFGYPLLMEWPWVFAQLYGTPGRCRLWLEVVWVDDQTAEERFVEAFGPRTVMVRPNRFVSGAAIRLPQLNLPEPGLYEFRLFLNGATEPAASERILAEE